MLPRVNLVRTDDVDYLLFSTRDALTAKIYDNGRWAFMERSISLKYCEDLNLPFVIDIGANVGSYAIPLAKDLIVSNGAIYAFEPQRISFYQLCGNIILNRLDNVQAFHSALGDYTGTIEIPDIDYSSSINTSAFSVDDTVRRKSGHLIEKSTRYRVNVEKLDHVSLPRPPTLIKIDVEGFEKNVIEGGITMLKDSGFPFLILEVWQDEWFADQRAEVICLLDDIGYSCFFWGDEIFAQHPDNVRQFMFTHEKDNKVRMRRLR